MSRKLKRIEHHKNVIVPKKDWKKNNTIVADVDQMRATLDEAMRFEWK